MRSIAQQFTIHPVGQGLFYSGIVKTNINKQEEIFRFVFDCGSLTSPAGKDEVERFRQEDFRDETDRLNLLVISHFDADHVNHIKRLLETNRKVDKVVMPFVEFEERLFLVLRYMENKNVRPDDEDLDSIRFILDPEGELRPHLSDDDATSIFLVITDPDNPTGNGESNSRNSDGFVPQAPGLEFGFNGEVQRLTQSEKDNFLFHFALVNDRRVGIVKDSVIGDVHFKSDTWLALMEFVFYRREASSNEKLFYKAVFEAFCKRFKIDTNNRSTNLVDAIVDALRKIVGATEVRKCYNEAKKKVPGVKISGRDILNMNATALCMLHRNLKTVISLFGDSNRWGYNSWGPFVFYIEKPFGSGVIEYRREVIKAYPWDYSHVPFKEYRRELFEACYPNVLLTSDSYLKLPEEADKFLEKYKSYHNKYWLFQLPHHGSKNNIDRNLLTQLPNGLSKFINYGIRHKFEKKFSHPHPETIQELIASGQFERVHAVNEITGLCFYFYMQTV